MNMGNAHYGPRIGSYMGKPIFESFRNQQGTFVFDRIAWSDDEGYPLEQLGKNEVLFQPGLIYRQTR
ncbi:MAG TPA: hypothetical protein VKA14_09235 [Gammaproteobacteria bacterium]|nr:hypothetical protein [Gammaproteobacteria bacterium]